VQELANFGMDETVLQCKPVRL